jgi:hypothetical protein
LLLAPGLTAGAPSAACDTLEPTKTGHGSNWVILAVVARLPGISRPAGIPVMAKLVIKGSNSKSRLWLARRMTGKLAGALPGRVVADFAYAGCELKEKNCLLVWFLPGRRSWVAVVSRG